VQTVCVNVVVGSCPPQHNQICFSGDIFYLHVQSNLIEINPVCLEVSVTYRLSSCFSGKYGLQRIYWPSWWGRWNCK